MRIRAPLQIFYHDDGSNPTIGHNDYDLLISLCLSSQNQISTDFSYLQPNT